MKDSVSASHHWGRWGPPSPSLTCPCPTELPARVLRAGPQGAGPGRAPAALYLPCAPARHAQRAGDSRARVQPPEEVDAAAAPSGPGGRGASGGARQGLTVPPRSVLKDHCVQHLPDGSVTVESILIQAAAHSEDPGTKVLLVSWTYQVRCGTGGVTQSPWAASPGPMAPLACGCRTRSWEATSRLCSRRACPRPAEAPPPGLCAPWVFPVSSDVEPTAGYDPHLCRDHSATTPLPEWLLLAEERNGPGGLFTFYFCSWAPRRWGGGAPGVLISSKNNHRLFGCLVFRCLRLSPTPHFWQPTRGRRGLVAGPG